MKIYIEQIIITNFIIDFCIMLMISKLLFSKTNYGRIFLSSFVGSLTALIIPICPNNLIINAIKILSAIVMLQIIKVRKKQLPLSVLLMLAISYIIGGCILSNFGVQTQNGYMIRNSSLLIIFTITLISTFITLKIIRWVKSKVISNSHIYSTILTYKNNSINIKSFIDSGNSLSDLDNTPISLINFNTLKNLTNISLDEYLNNDFSKLNNPHFITANTIAGTKKVLVFNIDKLTLIGKSTNTYYNVKIGVATHFDNSKEYNAILNSYFCFN